MNIRTIRLIVAVVMTTAYIQPQRVLGQSPSPVATPSLGKSEIWHKLQRLQSRIVDVHFEPDAKNKVIDDFIATEGPALFQELIDRIKEGFYSRSELRKVAEVMIRIKPSPADKLISQINSENDPNQQAMLVYCLGYFDGPNVIAALRKALDDTRPSVHPWRSIESAPWPVHNISDEAYLALLPKVQKSKGSDTPTPAVKLPRDDKERERRNHDLKAQLDAAGY